MKTLSPFPHGHVSIHSKSDSTTQFNMSVSLSLPFNYDSSFYIDEESHYNYSLCIHIGSQMDYTVLLNLGEYSSNYLFFPSLFIKFPHLYIRILPHSDYALTGHVLGVYSLYWHQMNF